MSDKTIEEIKERLDVAEVIGEYIPLRRAGANFKAVCPFHSEKSPSFMINRERQIWRCFGCNEGGDIFSFVQKFESLTFPETLKILAAKAGVQLPEPALRSQGGQAGSKVRDDLFEINELAARYYHEALLKSKTGQTARVYLKKRGVSDDAAAKWQLGFAPQEWHAVEDFFKKRGRNQSAILQAGLLTKGDKGRVYDRFRFRLMFPLHDHHGRIVGFTARALAEDEKAKYINSPETPVYSKSHVLYGYYFAKQAIRKSDSAVIVEGNMDCLSSHQAGVENVVASSGTALTRDQLKLLARLTKNIIFAFDQDKAGQAATRRGLELALSMDFNIRIVKIESKDPDELIRESPELWKKALREAPHFLDFSFESIFGKINLTDRQNLRKAAYDYLDLVALLPDSLAQAQESKRVAEKLDVPVTAVLDYLKQRSLQPQGSKQAAAPVPQRAQPQARAVRRRKERREMVEERILALALAEPSFAALLHEQLSFSDFLTVVAEARIVFNEKNSSEALKDPALAQLKLLGEQDLDRLRKDLSDDQKLHKIFIDFCRELKEIAIREEMKDISRQMAEKEKDADPQGITRLQERFKELSVQLVNITRES